MSAIEILRGGAATLVQDLGRPGHSAAGVPRSGAMDPFAATVANRLVGNSPDAALLEILLRGPRLRATVPTRAALVGARFAATLDGRPVRFGERFELPAGSELDLGAAIDGARVFLALGGGLEVPLVLGSRSTDLRSGFGGWLGRPLAAGDRLPLGPAPDRPTLVGPVPSFVPRSGSWPLRALLGPQWERFTAAARTRVFAAEFRIAAHADRVGIRLVGPPLPTLAGAEIRPEPAWPGAIQVPGSGEAIVLGPDHPSTGGYAKLATVIAADLPTLAYLRPGDRIRFRPCSLVEARAALAEIAAAADSRPDETPQ